jgi:hypothetical protein
MTEFLRETFTTLWITLRSDEPLGILDSQYLENYDGMDGYVTIEHLVTGQRFDVPMAELPTETPGVPHDVFRGAIGLSGLPDGEFEIRGRVRDPQGNYTILGAVASPFGGERIQILSFRIVPGLGVIVTLCPLRINYGTTFDPLEFLGSLPSLGFELPSLELGFDSPNTALWLPEATASPLEFSSGVCS